MRIPILDLKRQYAPLRESIDSRIAEVVESQHFVLGPVVARFEEEFAAGFDIPHAIGCASGTDALLLPLRSMEPRPGDAAIVPAFTFFATAGAAANAGFRPIFCDVDEETFNVSLLTLEAAWTEAASVVIPVHLFGQMAPMEEILPWAGKRGVRVLEDCAQAIGATRLVDGKPLPAGGGGDWGAFSFFPTKNLGAWGDAGLVTTRREEDAERIRKLRVHGGVQMYHHEMVGTNSRLDALQAAVLSAKLPHLPGWTARRGVNAALYREFLADCPGVRIPRIDPGNSHVWNQFTIRAERRDELREHLAGQGIGSGVYYPVPLHLQPCFAELGYRRGAFPVAERLCTEVLSLPVHPELEEGEVAEVAAAIRGFYGAER